MAVLWNLAARVTAALLMAGLLALSPWAAARAHDLPYTLLYVTISPAKSVDVEIRCHLPALIMGAPQAHLRQDVLSAFLALEDPALDQRAAGMAAALARSTTLRLDEQVVSTPVISTPSAAILKRDAQVPSSSPRPSAPLRLSFQPPPHVRTFDLALPPELGPVVLMVRYPGGATRSYAVRDGERSPLFRLRGPDPLRDSLAALGAYFREGVRHVIPAGLDHVLFIAIMAIGAPRLWALVKLATLFTLAHSVTLALSSLGYVTAPSEVIEPLIALSIMVAALMNLGPARGGAEWLRHVVVFGIGLLHGLGFAGALSDLGLPRETLAEALVGFNLGVEAGQILVILAVLASFGWLRGREWYPRRIVAPASIVVACIGVYLAVERLMPTAGA